MPDEKKTEDTIPQTFEEKYAKEIAERTSAGLPVADAISVQKAQVRFDQAEEVRKAKLAEDEAKKEKKKADRN